MRLLLRKIFPVWGSFITVGFPSLKAVLIVGPIDGDDGNWTSYEKRDMDLAATGLQANGVTVHRFHTPDNDWEQIKSAAQGAPNDPEERFTF